MWEIKVKQDNNTYEKVMIDEDTKEIILHEQEIEVLSEAFLNKLINAHDEDISKAFREGMKEGIQMAKDTYKIK